MPELPEVEITMRKLTPKIKGRKIVSFTSDWPRGLKTEYKNKTLVKDIVGRKIKRLSRHGKVLFLHLTGEDDKKIAFHQRMSGRLVILPKGYSDFSAKHVRVKIGLDDKSVLLFIDPRKFGIVWYGSDKHLERDKYLSGLGTDALVVSWKEFKEKLSNGRGSIKPFLLKQDIFSGIGNIIADETLWFSRIHPKRKVDSLAPEEQRALFMSLKKVLDKSINLGGSSMRNWFHPDESSGEFQKNWRAYGRNGKLCYRCKSMMVKERIGGRGTVYCPNCQK